MSSAAQPGTLDWSQAPPDHVRTQVSVQPSSQLPQRVPQGRVDVGTASHPIPHKRPRQEGADDALQQEGLRGETQDSSVTETYDLPLDLPSEDEDDVDGSGPFALVTYKKNRRTGIPVVFRPADPSKSLWSVNPTVIAHEVQAAAQEKIVAHRFYDDGSLMVRVLSFGAANNLGALTDLAGVQVRPTIPSSYSNNQGKVRGVSPKYDDDMLVDIFKDFGVTAVRRQKRTVRREDGTFDTKLLDIVVLTFKPDKPLPSFVRLGFENLRVLEYIEGPIQCYNCQRFGHMQVSCNRPRRCKTCSGPHSHKECTARREPRCANCGGSHAAAYSGCRVKQAATAARRNELLNGMPAAVRRPRERRRRKPRMYTGCNHDLPPAHLLPPTPKGSRTYAEAVQASVQCAPGNGARDSSAILANRDAQITAPGTSDTRVAAAAPQTTVPRAPRVPEGEAESSAALVRGDFHRSSHGSHLKADGRSDRRCGSVIAMMRLMFSTLRGIIRDMPDSHTKVALSCLLQMESLLNELL